MKEFFICDQYRGKAKAIILWRKNRVKKKFAPHGRAKELMQYLIRLFAPPEATILDCFMGSGSTDKAVMLENKERGTNYQFIGIELDSEFCRISKARIDYFLNQFEYETKVQNQEDKEKGILNIFDFL